MSTCDCGNCKKRGPCSICGRMFVDCRCTPEQQIKAWRDWFTANADPEAVRKILEHEGDDA